MSVILWLQLGITNARRKLNDSLYLEEFTLWDVEDNHFQRKAEQAFQKQAFQTSVTGSFHLPPLLPTNNVCLQDFYSEVKGCIKSLSLLQIDKTGKGCEEIGQFLPWVYRERHEVGEL